MPIGTYCLKTTTSSHENNNTQWKSHAADQNYIKYKLQWLNKCMCTLAFKMGNFNLLPPFIDLSRDHSILAIVAIAPGYDQATANVMW